MKHYVTMKLVIVHCMPTDIITTSGNNEIKTDVSQFFGGFGG